MGHYFKVIDKNRMDGRIDYIEADEIYDSIEIIAGIKHYLGL